MALPVSLLCAVGAERLWRQRVAGRAALATLLIIHGVQTVRVLRKELFVPNDRMREGIQLLRRLAPPDSTIVSVERNPMLYVNSCQKAWFVQELTVPALEACAGQDVDYLLLTTPVRYRFTKEPGSWSRLNERFEELGRSHHFAVWRRRK